jgi:phospholipid transport system transporter-binding protein
MIESVNGRLCVGCAMVTDNARRLFERGQSMIVAGEQVFDLSAVADADSSAVAVMLGWLRHAAQAGAVVRFAGVPAGVLSLAELYGVSDLLPLA